MLKLKLFCIILVILVVFSSCGVVNKIEPVTDNSESEPESEITTETTTEEELSTEEVTEPETEPVSETTVIESTTKAQTTKAVTSTTIPETVKQTVKATTAASTTAFTTDGVSEYVVEKRTVNNELSYGVIVYKTVSTTYKVLTSGSRVKVDEKTEAAVYNRTFFVADYDDMLPAAKSNRKKYADYINEVLRITNNMRAEKGVAPLKLSEKLTEQACVRAEEIAWSGKHSHYRPGGRYFSTYFADNGYTEGTVGENIGWNYPTPEKICQAWKESEGHYANILDSRFVCIGIGVAADCDPDDTLVWAQHFYSVDV